MATQIVELTGDEAALLRSYDRAVKKQAELEAKLRAGGDAGAAAGVQIEDALAKVKNANDQALRGLLSDLAKVSPQGATAAEGLKSHFVEAGKAGFKSMAMIMNELRAIDPAAAEVAASLVSSVSTAADDSTAAFQKTLSTLSDLGPEGAQAASRIREDMRRAAAQSAGSFDELLGKLAELDPTAASSAEAIRASMAAAASDTSGRLNAVLDEMRSLGPAGRKAAEEIKAKFVEAGKISERSVIDIAKAFESIDPEAAAAADAIIKQMQRGTHDSEVSFKAMGRSMLGELAAIAGGYVGIQEAIQLVNGHIEQQRQLLSDTRNAHIELAAAQQDTFKNLIAADVMSQSKLIREAVPQLAVDTKFPDVAKITLAIGAGKSAGGTDEQILSAIRAAAPLNRRSPAGLDDAVQGSLLLGQTTGIDDARQNLNLLLATADPALVKDPNKLAQLVPAAVANTVATTTGQDPVVASREAAALFAAINKGANDFNGESTVTNQATFTAYLREFFKNREGDPGTVFGRLGQLQNNKELRDQFLEKMPGEAKFKVALEQLTEASSVASQRLKENFEQIKTGLEFYNQKLTQTSSGTPQLALATFEDSMAANSQASKLTRSDDAMLESIRKQIAPALAENRPSGWFASTFNYLSDTSSRMGNNASDAAFEGVQRLLGQIAAIQSDGIQPGEMAKIASLQGALKSLFQLVESNAQFSDAFEPAFANQTRSRARRMAAENQMAGANPIYAESYNRLADLLERVAKSNEEIAASNQAMVAPTEATAASAAQTARGVSKTPSVVGALGSAATGP